ncbi:MAG: glycosyltransferase family 9 protein [Rikenellaceae bacterium]|jgi:ADP-heptose:LPS heptosyltransferase|nr:glycosyltransferase family 9 protein [Rikenellaceae bacterium]
MQTPPAKSRHILVMRLSAMGDVAMCVPVVAQLRRELPGYKITVLTRRKFQIFFRDIPDIEFFTPDFDGAHKGLAGLWRLARELSEAGVDAVMDLHDVLRTQLLRLFLVLRGKRVARVEKGRLDKRALTRRFRKIRVHLTPTVERYRQAFTRLGLKLAEPAVPPREPRPLPEAAAALTGPKEGVWIGVAPFAQHKGKVYPTILTDALIGLLAERFGRVFVFGGGEYEMAFAECMEQRHKGTTSVIGRLGLGEEMDLISNLDCMVTMDSASMHIASLVATPVVSIWGATHPYAGFYGFGQNPDDAVQLDLPCRPCSVYGNRPCIYRDYRCLANIPPTTVLEQVTAVIGRNR